MAKAARIRPVQAASADGAIAVPAPEVSAKARPRKPPKTYVASINGQALPAPFAAGLLALEGALRMPLWFVIQGGGHHSQFAQWVHLSEEIVAGFRASRTEMPRGKPIALLIDSPGGYAETAYTLARVINTHCGAFTAVVPRFAKSAATLLTLGSSKLIMGQDASLGPLDAQFFDADREEPVSALDEVHALNRLHSFALEAVDRTMLVMVGQSGKKVSTLLPLAFRFCATMIRPLFENIDPVHYTKTSRILKVAEEYAVRLLRAHHKPEPMLDVDDTPTYIARRLVEHYPDHTFNIDRHETRGLGLRVIDATTSQQRIMDSLVQYLPHITAIGRVKEVTANAKKKAKKSR